MGFKLFAWGANSHGQLGLGHESEQSTLPTEVPTVHLPPHFCEQVSAISGGGGHCMFLTKSGSVFACGWNNRGQLGLGIDSESCSQITQLPEKYFQNFQVQHIRTGWDCSAAIGTDGSILMWGSNSHQQFAVSNKTGWKSTNYPRPILLPDNEPCKDLQFGLRNTVFLTPHHMYIVGSKKLALSLTDLRPFEQILHNGIEFWQCKGEFTNLAVGQNYVAFVDKSIGLVETFGDKRFGQTTEKISSLGEAVCKVESGWTHGGYLNGLSQLHLWGRNCYGQLGQDPKITGPIVKNAIELNMLPQTDPITDFVLGAEHGLCLTRSKIVWAWGWNEHGNCGNGDTKDVYKPICVSVPGKCMQIAAGSGFCYVVTDMSPLAENET